MHQTTTQYEQMENLMKSEQSGYIGLFDHVDETTYAIENPSHEQ